MRLENVDRHQPRLEGTLLAHEVARHQGTPGGLRVLGVDRDAPRVALRLGPLDAVRFEIHAPHVVAGPGVGEVVAPPHAAIAVVDAILQAAAGAGREVQFSNQAAFVAVVGQDARNEPLVGADSLSVGAQAGDVRIAARQKAGARGRADRILRHRLRERDRLRHELAQVRCADVGVVQPFDGVIALLVGAHPEDVGQRGPVRLARRLRPVVRARLLRAGPGPRGPTGGEDLVDSSIFQLYWGPAPIRKQAISVVLRTSSMPLEIAGLFQVLPDNA